MPKRKSVMEPIMEPTEERGPYGDLKARYFKREIGRMTGIKYDVIDEVFKAMQDLTAEELYWYSRVTIPGLVTLASTEREVNGNTKVGLPEYAGDDGYFKSYVINCYPDRKLKMLLRSDLIWGEDLPEPTRNNWKTIVSAVRTVIYGKVPRRYLKLVRRNKDTSELDVVIKDMSLLSENRLLAKKDRELVREDPSIFPSELDENRDYESADEFLEAFFEDE